jgi:endonuclease YncB( thermonuclease family)
VTTEYLEHEEAWHFHRVAVVDVVDGDTLDLEVDLGFDVRRTVRVRLYGVDTAEIHTVPEGSDEYQRGQEHARFVREWVAATDGPWPFRLTTERELGLYSRYTGVLVRKRDGVSLSGALHAAFDDVQP